MTLRKDFVFLTNLEKTRLASAFNQVEASGFLENLAQEHNANFNNGIHWGSAFLPWHRHFLRRLETELQNVEHPDVMIPYWDWTRPDSRSLDAEPWKSFFGGRNNTGGQFDHWSYTRDLSDPPSSSPNPNHHLPVLVSDATPARSIVTELDKSSFATFRSLEGFGSHPPGHVWTGGTMAGGRSPADPLFWLHHCNIDRLWAIWQRNNPTADQYNTDPAPSDSVAAAMVPLNSPMIGGATPASMLDHTALGYSYATDVRLEAAWEAQGLGRLVTGDATATDFYIRDSASDTGEPPSPVPHWHSPDIWVRNEPPGPGENPDDGHQAPIVSRPNHVYVRVHNRGQAQTQPVSVEAYRCTPGTGMLWPQHFNSLGSLAMGVIGPGTNTRVGPFVWTPTVEGHECLLAIVRTEAEDPGSLETLHGTTVPAGTAASIDHSLLVRFDNNVGQRNVAPVLASPGSSTKMGLVINGLGHTTEHSLTISAADLPDDTAIFARLANGVIGSGSTDMTLDERNGRFTTLGLQGGQTGNINDVTIRANQNFTLTLTIDFSFNATHLDTYPLVVQQRHDGSVIGTYTVELTAVKDLEDFYFGNPRSRELHVSTCPFWDRLDKKRLRTYERVADGQARGYNGCRFCLPAFDTG